MTQNAFRWCYLKYDRSRNEDTGFLKVLYLVRFEVTKNRYLK